MELCCLCGSCEASSKLMLKVNSHQTGQRTAKQVQTVGELPASRGEPEHITTRAAQKKDALLQERGCSRECYSI